MIVYCILGIEYIQGFSPIPIPKIFSIHQTKEEALEKFDELKYLGDELYINAIDM